MTDLIAPDGSASPGVTAADPSASAAELPSLPVVGPRRPIHYLGWVGFGIFLLVFLTLLKLPESRITRSIQGTISSELSRYGSSVSIGSSSISWIFGPAIQLKDLRVRYTPDADEVFIDSLDVSPSIFTFLTGGTGASLKLYQGDSRLKAKVSMKGSDGSVSFSADHLDLSKLGLMSFLSDLAAKGKISGEGDLKGTFTTPSTLQGEVSFQFDDAQIMAQNFKGFQLPRMNLGKGDIELSIAGGRAVVKKIQIGETGKTDLTLSVTGDATLGKQWDASQLNLKAKFTISDAVKKAFVLIDALLGNAKQADGSYMYQLQGPLSAPAFTPGG